MEELFELASIGDPEAQYLLATEYVYGDRVQKNLRAAFFWYLLSACNGYTAGKWDAALMLLDGEHGGKKDLGSATILLESAAAAGHKPSKEVLGSLRGYPQKTNESGTSNKTNTDDEIFATFSDELSFELISNCLGEFER